ncbi:polyprenyl synthetase family protein [Thiomonas bhubaneswarensis]|uniref:Octaprenyl diphosphate synthase n=1 Tax=Thiomonas bhubaneswarensis TaxID=339866 RepID=A0A0K6HYA5_9BURK|nr:Geranylgeranyl pyrophosphate synthase [Thiomonas bhubaneswarensis]
MARAPTIHDVFAPIKDDMACVDQAIHAHLASEVALINTIGGYIVAGGGKRLRPALLLLVAQALGFRGTQQHVMAAVVELIHTATLLHDDVVDESSMRRGRETSNALFGNSASVLVGDFLYSRAFQMMVSVGNMRILDILADATNVIAEGEVLQLLNMHDPEVDEQRYLQVIRFKTAKLFEAAARIGAVLADSTVQTQEQLALAGRSFGTAFQLIDDLLDYNGNSAELGKNIGDDLREGKPTLPLIIAMRQGTTPQRALIENAIRQGDTSVLDDVMDIVQSCGAMEAVRKAAQDEIRIAEQALHPLPASPARQALLDLCAYSLGRTV